MPASCVVTGRYRCFPPFESVCALPCSLQDQALSWARAWASVRADRPWFVIQMGGGFGTGAGVSARLQRQSQQTALPPASTGAGWWGECRSPARTRATLVQSASCPTSMAASLEAPAACHTPLVRTMTSLRTSIRRGTPPSRSSECETAAATLASQQVPGCNRVRSSLDRVVEVRSCRLQEGYAT